MKKKSGMELRDVCDEHVIMAYGKENMDFSQVICLNESAAYLWRAVGDDDFDAERMADLLCSEYEVEREHALVDSKETLEQWIESGLVE